jgi:ribose 5-phosphate isomerase B
MIAIGSDHAGYGLKQIVMAHLKERGEEFKDYGTYSEASCDYPDYAEAVSQAIIKGEADRAYLSAVPA